MNDALYRRKVRRVWLWKEWPGRWGADAGIDLVAEARDGALWAIQAKVYEPEYWIKRADVDSFIAEADPGHFDYRLLIATTNLLGTTAKRTIDRNNTVGLLLLADLQRSPVDWPASPEALRPAKPHPKKPFPHNRQAVNAVCRGFERADRGQLIMACGTGKTLVGLWVSEGLKSERTLVLLPSLSLLSQTMREWTTNAARDNHFDLLAVCSDQTVRGEDALVEHTTELGLPVTTEPRDIAAFLRRRGQRVVFSTYQSSGQLAAVFRHGRVPPFDLAIADEAHRCVGPSAGPFATVLDDTAIRARRRLFMTATPKYFTSRVRREAEGVDHEVASMDDRALFGSVFHRLTFTEAIRRHLLADYQVAIVGVDDIQVKDYATRGVFVTTDHGKSITDARTLAAHVALAKAIKRYDLGRVVSFHSRVEWAARFSTVLPQVVAWMPRRQRPTNHLWCRHVSGAMSSGQRDTILDAFRSLEDGETGVLSNARCLAEGVNVPAIDGVAFIDPRRSQVDIVQAVGRAIRLSDEKKAGTVILPVFIESSEGEEAALNSSSFKPVWDVVRALRAHDDDLAEQLDALRRELGRRRASTAKLRGKVKIDLPVRVGRAFVDALNVRLVTEATASWQFWFGLLRRYVGQTGHAHVPADEELDGHHLGAWVAAQRSLRRDGHLSDERVRLLAGLPGWSWDPKDEVWESNYAALQTYVAREHHALVAQKHVERDLSLGHWVSTQRAFLRRGELEPERQKRLEAVPGWTWDTKASSWEATFAVLQDYVTHHGTARVPQDKVWNGKRLGVWVTKQRGAYNRGVLARDRQEKLANLKGWTWDTDDSVWEEFFDLLTAYVRLHHDSNVPQIYKKDGMKLGRWVVNQRSRRRFLTDEQRKRLEALDGWAWNVKDVAWQRALAAVKKYASKHGQFPPRGFKVGNINLGTWVTVQRRNHHLNRLRPDRRRRLDREIPGWDRDHHEDQWKTGYRYLQAFVKSEGHARVPDDLEVDSGFDLGGWVERQRSLHRKRKLPEKRQRRLERVKGWVWDAHEARWETAFDLLQQWVKEHGDAAVPAKKHYRDFPLGHWVATQRACYRRHNLSHRRAARLKGLDGWWWSFNPSKPKPAKSRNGARGGATRQLTKQP